MMSDKKMCLVSACLAGIECRYDCASKTDLNIQKMVEEGRAIPVCPEQLGGLPTPRPPAEIIDDKVLTKDGVDVTEAYKKGAQEAFKILELSHADTAYLKSKSPMCGSDEVYDGTFSGTLKKGDGFFTRLLKKAGIKIIKC